MHHSEQYSQCFQSNIEGRKRGEAMGEAESGQALLLVLLPLHAQPPGASILPSTTPSSLNFYPIPPDL